MMARRLHQTTADYIVLAISPALITMLVGSLVYFLLAVLYQGDFAGRLHWVMACFVFAAVLIGRISIEEGFERAVQFGLALAIPVGIAAMKFVELQGTWIDSFGWVIVWALIALIWWCAHRLTWDCTLIDDAQDASGEGLLQTVGLDRAPNEALSADLSPDMKGQGAGLVARSPALVSVRSKRNAKVDNDIGETNISVDIEGTTSRSATKKSWWQRYLERQRRPHAPGVWVVYFSLAALPLFGVGQWFIPATNVGGRRYAFWLLCVYVGSGLGLLLTTSFLGLRRYLRQRRIEMPTLMANLWLGTGGALIGLLLVAAALVPRPSAEYSISQLPFSVGSPNQRASRMAPTNPEGAEGDEPGRGTDPRPEEEQPERQAGGEQPGEAKDEKSEAKSPDSSGGKSEAGGGKSSGSKGKGSGKSKGGGKSQPKENESKQDESKSNSKSDSEAKSPPQDQQSKADEENNSRSSPPEGSNDTQPATPPEQTKEPSSEDSKADQQSPPADRFHPPQVPPVVDSIFLGLANIAKLLFYAIVALAVLYGLWRSRARIWEAIREFFSSFFGRTRAGSGADDADMVVVPPVSFASYADPFASGIAGRYTTEELIRYSFEAFEAWAREHGCARGPDQTPHELARVVGRAHGYMAADAGNLAELYARAAYAREEPPATSVAHLQHLWAIMRSQPAGLPV